jgi:hypothetical protein
VEAMTTDQYDVLLEKAYRAATGRGPGLSAADLQAVVAELQEPGDPRRRPILLKILGYTGDVAYRSLVEPFLTGPDPAAAHWALYVLCRYWGLTAQYIPQIRAFLRRLPWDDLGMVQETAFFVAEDYLAGVSDPGLVGEMIQLAEGRGTDERTRELAQEALVRLSTKTGASPENALKEAPERLGQEERHSAEGQGAMETNCSYDAAGNPSSGRRRDRDER